MSLLLDINTASHRSDESYPLIDSAEHSAEHRTIKGYLSSCHTNKAVSGRVDVGTKIAD